MPKKPGLTVIKDDTDAPKKEEQSFDFEEIQRQNKENAERMKSDRNKANRGVKRSYRLKGKDNK